MLKRVKKENEESFFRDDDLPSKWKMRKRINTLENEKETLEEIIKSELYKDFMNKLGEPEIIKNLREENKRLKIQNKKFKEELKNANSKK